MNWNILDKEELLEQINKESEKHPVLIFKHSTRCSISSAAKSRLERSWNDQNVQLPKPYYLDLLTHRNISDRITVQYGVIHQSPQVIIIENGKSTYDTSHMMIDYESILSHVI